MAANVMLKFVTVTRDMPAKRGAGERSRDFHEIYREYRGREGGGAGGALLAVRRALLPVALPAAQQHPRLADADRRGAAARGLRAQPGHQHLPRDLRAHLPAGPALRGQLRHRAVGPRHRHHRRGGEVHHRHRLGGGLGAADPRRRASGRRASASSAPGRAAWRRRTCCGARGCRSRSTTATTARAGCWSTASPASSWRRRWCCGATLQLAAGGVEFRLNCNVGEDIAFDEIRGAARRGADRHRRLQVARPRRPGRGARRASCGRSTT